MRKLLLILIPLLSFNAHAIEARIIINEAWWGIAPNFYDVKQKIQEQCDGQRNGECRITPTITWLGDPYPQVPSRLLTGWYYCPRSSANVPFVAWEGVNTWIDIVCFSN